MKEDLFVLRLVLCIMLVAGLEVFTGQSIGHTDQFALMSAFDTQFRSYNV